MCRRYKKITGYILLAVAVVALTALILPVWLITALLVLAVVFFGLMLVFC